MTLTLRWVTGPIYTPEGTLPLSGRIEFQLPVADSESGQIVGPVLRSFALDSMANFNAPLWVTTTGARSLTYATTLKWWDAVRGVARSAFLGYAAVPAGGGSVQLASLLTDAVPEPTPTDLVALIIAKAAEAESSAATATAAAAAAATYAQVDFPTHAAAVAYVAGSGSFVHGHSYSVAGVRYVGMTGATFVPGLAGLTFLPPGYRLRNPATNTHYEMGIGQSYIIGSYSDTTGLVFAANGKVEVMAPTALTWGTPTVSVEPFNPSGSNCELLDHCNWIAEHLPYDVKMILSGAGGTSISAWVGTPADRTVSVGNRPMWVKLQAMMGAAGVTLVDKLTIHHGVADHALAPDVYATEIKYLISQAEAAGWIDIETPILVIQTPNGDNQWGRGLSLNSIRTNQMLEALRDIGDPRIHLVDTHGVDAPAELVGGSDTFRAHFSDAGMRVIGRERMVKAWMRALSGASAPPRDPGLTASMNEMGYVVGSNRITKIVGTGGLASPYSASERDVNNHIQVDAGSTIILPDFSLSGYGSALDGSSGAEIYFWPKGAGSYTFQIEAGSTGKVIGQGGLAMAAVATSMVYSPSTANARMPIVARWVDGALWHIEPYRGLGRDQKVFNVAVNPASMAAGTYLNITGIAAAGAKVGDKMSIVTPLAWSAHSVHIIDKWVEADDLVTIRLHNQDTVTRDEANVAVTFTVDVTDI